MCGSLELLCMSAFTIEQAIRSRSPGLRCMMCSFMVVVAVGFSTINSPKLYLAEWGW